MVHLACAATGAALLTLAAVGCSSSDDRTEIATPPPAAPVPAMTAPTPTATPTRTAAQYATALKAAMPRITRAYQVTEKNDPNDLIGRPNGYTSATVLPAPGATCTGAADGIDCGLVIEVWPNAQAVATRVAYIQGILKNAPALGSEFDYPAGAALLRVNGKVVRPADAKVYEQAWRKVTAATA